MKPMLRGALKRLPGAKSEADIRFYWRVVLSDFYDNEEEIADYLWSLSPLENDGYWKIVRKMPELTCRAAICFFRKFHGKGNTNIMIGLPLIYEKFTKLTLDEQIKIIEENRDARSEEDLQLFASLLARCKFTGPRKQIADYLNKAGMSTLHPESLAAFLTVARTMESFPV